MVQCAFSAVLTPPFKVHIFAAKAWQRAGHYVGLTASAGCSSQGIASTKLLQRCCGRAARGALPLGSKIPAAWLRCIASTKLWQNSRHYKRQMIQSRCRLANRRAVQIASGPKASRALQARNGSKIAADWQPAGHLNTKWLQGICGMAARRTFKYQMAPRHLRVGGQIQVPNRTKADGACRTFKYQTAPSHLRVGGLQQIQVPNGSAASAGWRRTSQIPNGPKASAGWQPAEQYQHRMVPK